LRAASLDEFPDPGSVVPEAPDSGYRHRLVDGYRLLYQRIGIREGGTVQVAFARR
jgi:hypothetical protein